ncbi:hypothetical protein AB7942_29855 [Neobacillus sp. BF23-41]|uniref:hypothetical protein n=1 Tax=Neobacillus sp. BF23-41 TaxID=3240280 RepID=UPI0034E5014A
MPNIPLFIPTLPISKKPWDIFDANGKQGDFIISHFSPSGSISGTLNSFPFTGQWDEVLSRITFSLRYGIQGADLRDYTGYMFRDETNTSLITLTGSFKRFIEEKEFGWYAQTQLP